MKKEIIKFKLNNGLRVVLVPEKESLTTTVLILVNSGSEYERKENNGISHFLEHMCFKGTKKRPSQLIVSNELESLGAKYNAFTSQEYTGYYAKVINEKFEYVLDIIADIYLNPLLDEKEIEKEKGPIIEEINMYEDLPNRKVEEIFLNLVYKDQPAGWPIAGTKENILKFKRDDFLNYLKEHYLANNTVLVISGNFKFKKIEEKIWFYFKDFKKGKIIKKPKVIEKQIKPEYKIFYKKTDQTHLILGFRAIDLSDERKYALFLLSEILGGGISSRLFQKIRTELGAAYYIYSFADLYTDHGLFEIAAGVNNQKVKEVIEIILSECNEIIKKSVKEEELKKAKESYISHLFMSLEKSDEWASFYGFQEVLNQKILNPYEIVKKIQKVDLKDIQKIAQFIFQNKKLNLALVGPLKDEHFSGILKL